jgi:hypothetical protein
VTREPDAGGGGLTGATGHLTPDESAGPFDPGERREAEDAEQQADVTVAQATRAPAQAGDVGDPERLPDGPPTNMATRDDGYGSEHGLSPNDPAYRMERRAHPTSSVDPSGPTRLGGDEIADEEERF